MADRTVTTRLRLDSSGWVTGQRQAVTANEKLAASSRAAAAQAERDAQRAAQAIAGTYAAMARAGEVALNGLNTAANRSAQLLTRNTTQVTQRTAAAATAASQVTAAASDAAEAAAQRVAAAAAAIPSSFRAAARSATSELGRVTATATASARTTAAAGDTAAAGTRRAAAAATELPAAFQAAAAAATASLTRVDATAGQIPATFRAAGAAGAAALGTIDSAAAATGTQLTQVSVAGRQALTASVAALGQGAAVMSATTAGAAAAIAASRVATQAATTAAQAERRVAVTAGEIPATFRAVSTAAVTGMGRVDLATASSMRQMTAFARANRQAVTASTSAVQAASTGMSAATARAAAGTQRLSLANRLALAQAAQASQAAVATSTAFGTAAARARALGSATVVAAGNSEKSLKTARTGAIALVAAFGLAVYASSRFETAMSGVKAATQAGAKELGQLRQAAIEAGATTQYSATQAADAETELAKAGVSTADILGGALRGTLSLAAAGQMDVADSAVVASKAMNAFGLSGSQMSHIADVIAAAAGKSATDVHGLSLAMAQSALLAHQTGLSIEQAAGALALFAQNGLVGSDAGTSLKTMLMRLTPQSAEARAEMDRIGFSAYDSSGKFVGWSETAARLQKSLANLTPEARNSALGVIFGSDAIRAATIVAKAGASGVDAWTRAANDQGYAARYAATQTDNLSGDLRRLKSALETALIQSGSAANGVLRDMAQELTAVVRWYSNLPPSVQKSVTVLAGLVGVVGLIGAGLLLMLPRIMAVRTELVALGLTAQRTQYMLGAMGRLSVVIGALTALSYAGDKISGAFDKAAPSVDKMTSSLVDLAQTGKVGGEAAKQFGDDLDSFGDAVKRVAHPSGLTQTADDMQKWGHGLFGSKAGSLKDAEGKIKSVDGALAAMVQSGNADLAAKSFKDLSGAAEKNGTSTAKLKTLLPQYSAALDAADAQQKLTTGSQKALGDQAQTTADDLQDTRTEAQKLTDALDSLNGVNISAAESEIGFRQSLADLKSSIKDNGHSLDIYTDKGRKNKQAFLDAADAATKHAEAVAQQKNSVDAGNRVLAADVEALKAQMLASGFSAAAVDKLLAAYAKLPPGVTTTIRADDKATAQLDSIRRKLAATKGKSVTVKAVTANAEQALKDLGFKVTHLKGGQVRITVPTTGPRAAIKSIKDYLATLKDKTITVTTNRRTVTGANTGHGGRGPNAQADGSVLRYRRFGSGGTEKHVAQIARAGEWRVWAEDETGGEAYIPLAPSKRTRSRAIATETVRLLGGKGIAWNGTGSVQRFAGGGFTYTPADPTSTLGVGAGMDRYTSAVAAVTAAGKALAAALADAAKKAGAVRDAERALSRVRSGHHTAAQLAAAEDKLTKARQASTAAAKKAAADRAALNRADAALGVRAGTTAVSGFNLAAYAKQLAAANAASAAWERNLAAIGKRAGQDVETILRGMGDDGTALVAALAKASGSQFAKIVAELRALAPTARATLADYTAQLNAANKGSQAFQANLLRLAAMGDTALASQLAAQGDDAAAAIAAAAVKSSAAASSANSAAATNAGLLSADDLATAVTLLGVLKSHPGAGIADVLAAGLDWATVRALAPRIAAQIRAVPGSGEFVTELRGQGVAMARGGILTRPTTVLAAEAGHTESWIPWNGSARSAALLAKTAAAMGYQLVPAGRWGGMSAAASGATTIDRSQTVHLHGAHQSLGEQRADLLRHMQALA